MTPMQYVLRVRINAASEALTTSDRTIAEIAVACGFYDQSYFTKQFRRQFGHTPTAYRERYQVGWTGRNVGELRAKWRTPKIVPRLDLGRSKIDDGYACRHAIPATRARDERRRRVHRKVCRDQRLGTGSVRAKISTICQGMEAPG